MIKKYKDIKAELDHMRHEGGQRGESTGFGCLDELYSLKQGSFTIILAAPHAGKSELSLELCLNQSDKHGKRSLIYSPETGSVADIYAEFVHKLSGKSIYKTNQYSCEDKEYYRYIEYIDHWFDIVDSDEKAYSLTDLYNYTDKVQRVNPVDIILADPWNEIDHAEMAKFGTRQDLYIEELMGSTRRFTKKKAKHLILTIHPSSQQLKEIDGIRHYPSPMAREAAGGQAFLRKAMTWINMWRPTVGLKDANGVPYEENQVVISIEKAKPKGVSFRGNCSLYFDWKRNRYYEKDFAGNLLYAFKHLDKNVNALDQNNSPIIKITSEEFSF